jgi:hypothetical protein
LSLWLQPLITYAFDIKIIDKIRNSKLISQLAYYRHEFLSINAINLLTILQNDNTSELFEFSTVADFIGCENADISSHINVVDEFVYNVWSRRYSPIDLKSKKATGILLEKTLRLTQWDDALAYLVLRNRTLPGLIDYIYWWFKGHFLPQAKFDEAILRIKRKGRNF